MIDVSHSEQEGSIDPVEATEALLRHAEANGGPGGVSLRGDGRRRQVGEALHGVKTTGGDFELDVLVVPAGVDTPKLAAMAGLGAPLVESPGVLAHTKPSDRLIEQVVVSPGAHMKQKARLQARRAYGLRLGSVTEATREEGEKVLESGKQYLPSIGRSSSSGSPCARYRESGADAGFPKGLDWLR